MLSIGLSLPGHVTKAASTRPTTTSRPASFPTSSFLHPVESSSETSAEKKNILRWLLWLREGTVPQRKQAILALGQRNLPPQSNLRVALAATLHDPHQEVRFLAALVISRWGVATVPLLRAALTDRNAKIRWSAAFALAQIGPVDAKQRVFLVRLSRDSYFRVRYEAVRGLSQERTWSTETRHVMVERLFDDPHPLVRLLAANALQRIPIWAIPVWLRVVVQDRHPLLRRLAARLAAQWAGHRPDVRARLLQALPQEKDPDVAVALFRLWLDFDKKQQATPQELHQLGVLALFSPLWEVRRELALLLAASKQRNRQQFYWLQQLRLDPTSQVRQTAEHVLHGQPTSYPKRPNHPSLKRTSP